MSLKYSIFYNPPNTAKESAFRQSLSGTCFSREGLNYIHNINGNSTNGKAE